MNVVMKIIARNIRGKRGVNVKAAGIRNNDIIESSSKTQMCGCVNL